MRDDGNKKRPEKLGRQLSSAHGSETSRVAFQKHVGK